MFADVAGLEDAAGELIEVDNSLILKRIFMNAKTVRFLIPISVVSITDGRGNRMRKHGKVI